MGTGDPTIICTICTNMDVLAEAYEFRCETCGRSVPNPVIALRAQLAAQAETIDTLRGENEKLKVGIYALDQALGWRIMSRGNNTTLVQGVAEQAEIAYAGELRDKLRELGLIGGDDVPSTKGSGRCRRVDLLHPGPASGTGPWHHRQDIPGP